MGELFDTINMRALDSAERERIIHEEQQAELRAAKKAKRHQATKKMLTRVGAVVLICAGLWLAGKFNLINTTLVLVLYAALFMWLAYWLGAFVQFMFCKGGLLEC